MMSKELTKKEKAFIDAYITPTSGSFGNALQSYKRAAYKASNDNIAGVEGFKLLKKPKIKENIMAIEAKREFDLQSEVDEHVQNISAILKKVASTGKYSRDDISALRTLGEFAGKLGSKGIMINLNLSPDEPCPHCQRVESGVRDLLSDYREIPKLITASVE